jgi:hypothetical protein
MRRNRDFATLSVGLSYYNQAEGLKRMLSSLEYKGRLIPHVVCAVDGVYRGFPATMVKDAGKRLSTDGSREVIRQFAKRHDSNVSGVSMLDAPELDEREKRQKYVDMAAAVRSDFLLIVDADEWLECSNWPAFFDELDAIRTTAMRSYIFGVRMRDFEGKTGKLEQDSFRPRLWFRPEKLAYFDTHWNFSLRSDPEPRVPFGIQEKLKSPLVINHDHACNGKDREEARLVYETDVLPVLESKRPAAEELTS